MPKPVVHSAKKAIFWLALVFLQRFHRAPVDSANCPFSVHPEPHYPTKQMRNSAPTNVHLSHANDFDQAIGQIDLIGESGEIATSWRIRSSKCTIGSAPDCSVQLKAIEVQPLHATLVFGKKHTLLRSLGPTLISNRAVREWLIDESTEIMIGKSRLVVHPTIGLVATLVPSNRLVDQANRQFGNYR